jgi:hypothetical protein
VGRSSSSPETVSCAESPQERDAYPSVGVLVAGWAPKSITGQWRAAAGLPISGRRGEQRRDLMERSPRSENCRDRDDDRF